VAKDDEKTTTTQPNSLLDLERRQADDYVPDSDVRASVTVNPNPYGEEDYVGTDAIYQNHANKTEAPGASKKGPEREAEQAHKKSFELDEDDDNVVDDPGLGGKALRANTDGPEPTRYLVPGQEGYDEKEQNVGGAVRADAPNKSGTSDDDNDNSTPPPPPPPA
jgi:hypothetical protein